MLLRIGQRTIAIQPGIEVIRTALLWIIGHVEHVQCRERAVVIAHITFGIEFARGYLAHIMIGELIEVTANMCRCERAAAPRK